MNPPAFHCGLYAQRPACSHPALTQAAFGAVLSPEHSIRQRMWCPQPLDLKVGGAGIEPATYGL